MKRLFKNWAFHNLVAHPLSEIVHWLTFWWCGDLWSEWIHDATCPVETKDGPDLVIVDWVCREDDPVSQMHPGRSTRAVVSLHARRVVMVLQLADNWIEAIQFGTIISMDRHLPHLRIDAEDFRTWYRRPGWHADWGDVPAMIASESFDFDAHRIREPKRVAV